MSGLVGKIGERFEPVRKVLGILGYSREFLQRYSVLSRTPLEIAEAINESRIIEHDVLLRSVEFSEGYPGINEPCEVELVEQVLRKSSVQQALLQEILQTSSV